MQKLPFVFMTRSALAKALSDYLLDGDDPISVNWAIGLSDFNPHTKCVFAGKKNKIQITKIDNTHYLMEEVSA